MTDTLDSVEAELAAAHEAVALHREVVRHQAEEIARLTLERDRALACEAAALGMLREWKGSTCWSDPRCANQPGKRPCWPCRVRNVLEVKP